MTRHNAGFLAVDLLCQRLDVRADTVRHHALVAAARLDGHALVLAKPQTYMNRSGEAVRDLAAAWQLGPERVIVLFDDASLLPGRVRVRRSGSDGGHNGIKSILYHLGSDRFPRIKIGIGGPDRGQTDMADYVLDTLDSDVWPAIRLVPDIVETIVTRGLEAAMQAYNGKAEGQEPHAGGGPSAP